MKRKLRISVILFLLSTVLLQSQSLFEENLNSGQLSFYDLKGFTRAGFFVNNPDNKLSLSTGFADLSLKLSAEDGSTYKAYADLRFRYGMEFSSPISELSINEAYVSWYSSWIEISAGQQIIRWSNSDFFKTQDRMNPRNDLYRTFDDGDRDLGNILFRTMIYPVQWFSLEILYLPFNRPSIVTTEIMDIPSFVEIDNPEGLTINNTHGSWGVNMGFNLKGIDIGLSWYKGSNPMPMIYYDTLILPQSPGDSPAKLKLGTAQYNTSMLSTNIELVAGKTIFRGELTYLNTQKDGSKSDYVPFSELILTTGIEPSFGNFKILLEYQGKYILDFIAPLTDPVFPESIDLPPGVPLEVLDEMVDQQISTFNRLYNYQINEFNHSLGCRLSFDNNISVIKPEISLLYSINTGDLMISPRLNIQAVDNLTMILGSEIFRGNKDSLYDLLDSQLTSIFFGLRVNF